MSRTKTVVTCVLAVAVLAVTLSYAQSGSGDSAVLEKLDALEKRIASLERTITTRMSQLEKAVASGGGGGGPSAALESEAQAAYAAINKEVAAGNYTAAKTQMDAFMKKYSTTNAGRQARRLQTELAVIGKDVPTEWGIDEWWQGESQVDLTGDKTTLLVFWEVWCPHCKREVPKMQALYDDLKDDGLQIVGLTRLTRSATEEGAKSFIAEQKVSYPIAKENGSVASWFGVSGIPAAAVVKNGKVVWRGHPARLSEAMLKDWL